MFNEIPDSAKKLARTEATASTKATKSNQTAAPLRKETTQAHANQIFPKNIRFTPFQLAILGILTFVFCAICVGNGLIYSTIRFDSPPEETIALLPATPLESKPQLEETPLATQASNELVVNTPTPTLELTRLPPAPVPSPTATYVVAPALINKDKIAEIIKFVEKQRQLSLPTEIPIKFLTRRQLREQWRDSSFDVATLEAVQTQQEFYRILGLIEPDVDLVEAAFDSQTNILLGYYTPKEKAMYIIAESVNMFAEEEMTFAHEYVHALQDYHFDLNNIITEDRSGDALLAARSLPEGDARLVEELFTRENIGQDELDYNIYRYLFQERPPLKGVSPALGIFTYFPYTAGEYFVIYLFIQGNYSWDLVNQAYYNLPVSSEQVMHPEKYLAGEVPIPIILPDLALALGNSWREIDRDVWGEAGFLVWLIDEVDDQTAINGAAGWDGDAYTLWVDQTDRRLLAESSLWASNAEATEFSEAFKVYMNLRGREVNSAAGDGVTMWEYEGGVTLLSRVERRVLLIIAPDRATLDSVRSQFAGF